MKIIRELYTGKRLYHICAAIVVMFIFGQYFDLLFLMAKISLFLFILLLLFDFSLLFFTNQQLILVRRIIPEKFSNGDTNKVSIFISNNHSFQLSLEIIDEIPVQFQLRDFSVKLKLLPKEEQIIYYDLNPKVRGEYHFGATIVYVSSPINLLQRRHTERNTSSMVKVYPAFLQMRKYEFLAVTNQLNEAGNKIIRKVGNQSEFDQIKNYVVGDNYRTINWKATARRSKLMVNQFQEERSQQIFCLIDKGRSMYQPFDGLSLLDYAINSSLILSNTALIKYDKAGLITFNQKIDTYLKADRGNKTIGKIQDVLYNQQTQFFESDYALLGAFVRRNISHRSLLVLFTNFESIASLHRQLNYFKQLAKNHLLLLIVFDNTELRALSQKEAANIEEIYIKTIAQKFLFEKKLIVRELEKNGIIALLTKPEELTAKLINKYIEIKLIGKI